MTERRAGHYVVGLASVLIFLSAFAHALAGWPALRQALGASVDPDVLGAIGVGWHFGSVAMAAFGMLGLTSVWQARRGYVQARWVPITIGVAYVVFGGAAVLVRGAGPHFLTFIVLGGLLFGGALSWKTRG